MMARHIPAFVFLATISLGAIFLPRCNRERPERHASVNSIPDRGAQGLEVSCAPTSSTTATSTTCFVNLAPLPGLLPEDPE